MRISLSFWALVVGLVVLALLFSALPSWGPLKSEAQQGYDYIVPLGEIIIFGAGGPLVLDQRTGNMWIFYVHKGIEKLESEYCGNIGELISAKRYIERELPSK